MVKQLAAIGLVLGMASGESAFADTITAPNNYYVGNSMPFGRIGNIDYQQIYSSSFFSTAINIKSLSFSRDPNSGPNNGFADGSYLISLSTTSVAVGALDPINMMSNLGTNNQTFFSGTLSGGNTITGTPFLYVPSDGNLLLTVHAENRATDWGTAGAPFDGLFWRADSNTGTSRAYYIPLYAQYGSAYGSDPVGLVTQFEFTPVPVPATLALLGLGLVGLARQRQVGTGKGVA